MAGVKVRTPAETGWLSTAAVVAHLEARGFPISKRRLERWMAYQTRPLPSIKAAGRVYVHLDDLNRWLEAGARGGATIPA